MKQLYKLLPADCVCSQAGNKLNKLLPTPRLCQAGKELIPSFLFYLSILFFIIGFNFSDNPAGGWYQQFLPNLSGAQLSDITFVDSLNGFATTLYRSSNDSAYILKTTNRGDNWTINTTYNYPFYRVQFINQDTGYVLSFQKLFKTTNKGVSWQIMNIALSTAFVNMYVLNTDTMWAVASESLTGGVYRTTNGGVNWDRQLDLGSQNPEKIYIYNARIGFISKNMGSSGYVRKTTDGGTNWDLIVSNDYYLDIYFADSLTGWKSSAFGFKKTINGGLNWAMQTLPGGGFIQTNPGISFSNINKDTIWSSGGYLLYPNNQTHGFLNRTTNGGDTWYFQIPDTSLNNVGGAVNFVNKLVGWATSASGSEIHTTTGGDTIFYLGMKKISSEIPKEFKLFQNYPNPFNPISNIKYQISKFSQVRLEVFDIKGKLVSTLVNEKQNPGEYAVEFDGSNLSSGVYFYRIQITDAKGGIAYVETNKAILIK